MILTFPLLEFVYAHHLTYADTHAYTSIQCRKHSIHKHTNKRCIWFTEDRNVYQAKYKISVVLTGPGLYRLLV